MEPAFLRHLAQEDHRVDGSPSPGPLLTPPSGWEVIEKLKRDGTRIEDDWLRRIGPAHFAHINCRGTMRFGVEKYADYLVQRQQVSAARIGLLTG